MSDTGNEAVAGSMTTLTRRPAIQRGLRALAADRRSGASEVALRAIRLFEYAEPPRGAGKRAYEAGLRTLGRRIAKARPAMASVEIAAARLLHSVFDEASACRDAREVFRVLRRIAKRQAAHMSQATSDVAQQFHQRFRALRRVVVTSYSSQLVAVLTTGHSRSMGVVVCESRPVCEGRRTARLLAGQVRSVTIVTDAEAGRAVSNADAVLLGCDAILEDGSVVNKTGSYLLALAARDHRKPVIVLGSQLKVTEQAQHTAERHAARDVWANAPRGVAIVNQPFEVVPSRLVDFIVLEGGVRRPQGMRQVCRRNKRFLGALRALKG